jgi:pimeloyl-ACP methyl ester carboxylesterase
VHSFNAAGTLYELRPLFERLAERRRVIGFDWLGFGRSERPARTYSPEVYLRVLRSVLGALGPGPLDVVALSLPSQYVAIAAEAEPHRFRRLALISPTGFGRYGGAPGAGGRAFYALLRLPPIGGALYRLLGTRASIRWFQRQLFADPERLPEGYERYAWATCQQPGARYAPVAFVSGVLRSAHAHAAYARLTMPTLLLFGDHPRFTDPPAGEALAAENPALRVELMSDCGDLPQFEWPEQTAALVGRFLADE